MSTLPVVGIQADKKEPRMVRTKGLGKCWARAMWRAEWPEKEALLYYASLVLAAIGWYVFSIQVYGMYRPVRKVKTLKPAVRECLVLRK